MVISNPARKLGVWWAWAMVLPWASQTTQEKSLTSVIRVERPVRARV